MFRTNYKNFKNILSVNFKFRMRSERKNGVMLYLVKLKNNFF